MTLAELPQIQALSAREKLELVDEIWKSVSANPDSLEVTQDEQELLNSRWTDFLQNPASALSVDDFKSQINTLRA